jgi:hypothetical protein
MGFLGVKDRQSTHQTVSSVSGHRSLSVEAFKHQYSLPSNILEPRTTGIDVASTRKFECCELDTLQVKAVALLWKFCNPKDVIIFDRGFWTRAT